MTSFRRSIDVDRLEQLLALLGGHVRAVGDHVGQQAGLGDVAGGDGGLRRHRARRWRRTARSGPGRVRISAWTSTPAGARRRAPRRSRERYGSVVAKPMDAEAALALDDGPDGAVLELDDLGDLGQRADLRTARTGSEMSSCSALALGDERDRARRSATAALSALTLFSRPTWSGTIISGKMTVSRRATSGSSRGPVVAGRGWSSSGVDGRLAIRISLSVGSWPARAGRSADFGGWVGRVGRCRGRRLRRRSGGRLGRLAACRLRRRALRGSASPRRSSSSNRIRMPARFTPRSRVRWRIQRIRRMSFSL